MYRVNSRRIVRLGVVIALLVVGGVVPGFLAQAAPVTDLAQVVVKVDIANGHSIDEVTAALPVTVESAVLASRGVYLLSSTDGRYPQNKAKDLAKRVEQTGAAVYAEENFAMQLSDNRFSAWPEGNPSDAGTDQAAWLGQPASVRLRLPEVHATVTGAGQIVAVLDTGVDDAHPALAGRVLPGWDFVDDDADPSEPSAPGNGTGHGTFVAGTVGLVAPGARILPYRVLDPNGFGNVFVVSEAINDAINSGAGVVNLSFGVSQKLNSKLINEAVKQARAAGVIVVAAAGNDVAVREEYPAAQKEVLAVTALDSEVDDLARFANGGKWVDVAAPGEGIIGPVPGDRYVTWAGTSMATPIVAGQAALLRQMFTGTDTTKLIDRVVKRISPLQSNQPFGAVDLLLSLQPR